MADDIDAFNPFDDENTDAADEQNTARAVLPDRMTKIYGENTGNVFLWSTQEEADKSIDFGESEIEQSTVFLESFRIGGYDEMAQVKDLHVTVDDPEKHIGSYVSYNVTTKTTRGQFDHPEYTVRRRYQDFLWLRQRLEESYPTHIVPPLPEKKSFSKRFDRFSTEFLKLRQIALNKFVSRIADHPVMSFNDNFHVFLTAKTWELTSVKKQSPGLMSRMSDSMRNMASSWMLKNREPEFQEMAEFTKTFREKMVALESVSDKIAKDRFDLLEIYKEYIPIFNLWADAETKLVDPLHAMANAFDSNSSSLKSLLKAQDPRFMEPLHEYVLYTDAIKSTLKHRDTIQMEYEVTLEELSRKKTEKEELEKGTGGGRWFGKETDQSKQDKLERVNTNIEELSKLSESGNDRLECANVDLKADIERWHKNKRTDFRDLLTEYSERHVNYYEECLTAWQEALNIVSGNPLDRGEDLEDEA
ncbi:Sorting nexin-30 [Acropora cervicornis]|uniref:Sorting nexin-30 n=1 Tax=Acropora cervicornis TaxID=6130 RepID=A0AAD9Q652_ACRCE|nr:Sorting nexin-30 [Acropora cervicornis]